jgi:hypothetical protein
VCESPDETDQNCPADCDPECVSGGCDPGCVTDGCVDPVCGDDVCEASEGVVSCPEDCDNAATGGTDLVPPGCLCRDAPPSGALALLLLLARRRRLS